MSTLPPDPALGGAPLTDPEFVLELARRAGAANIASLRLRYLEHEVGRSLLTHFEAVVDGDRRDLVASIGRLRRPDQTPDDITLAWFPDDLGLPLLREGFSSLGVSGPTQRLAWVPQRRAVFAVGDRVVKVDHDPQRVEAAVRSLERLRAVVRVPDVHLVDLDRGAFVQERIDGRPLDGSDALDWAPSAARLTERIAGVAPDGLPRLDVAEILGAIDPVVRLVVHAAPHLADRVEQLRSRLAATAPQAELAPAHGDFNIGQLIETGPHTLALVDTDTLCLAPIGFDLAAYATNVLSGRPGDLERCDAIARRLVESAERPAELDWLLAATAMRRLDRPIRRYKRKWPKRLERLVDDVATLLDR